MIPVNKCANLFALLAAATLSAAPNDALTGNSVTQAGTILVAEIERASPPTCGNTAPLTCEIPVRIRIRRILKDENHILALGTFEANLRQIFAAGSDRPWSAWTDHDIGPGQQYLVFSGRDGSLAELVGSPHSIELLTDAADSVADVELVLRLTSLSLADQISLTAAAVSGDSVAHGVVLAEYIGGLLTSGSSAAVGALSQALIGARDQALSDEARDTLLRQLFNQRSSAASGVIQLFAALTANYFAIDSINPQAAGSRRSGGTTLGAADCTSFAALTADPRCGAVPLAPGFYNAGSRPLGDISGLTHTQMSILDNYLPWILSSERATKAFRSALTTETARRLRVKAAETATDGSQIPSRRAEAQMLLALVGAQ